VRQGSGNAEKGEGQDSGLLIKRLSREF
jgi:hypothetical protein